MVSIEKRREYDRRKREKRSREGWENTRRAKCHPDQSYLANGLCTRCYHRERMRRLRKENRQFFRDYEKKYYHENRSNRKDKLKSNGRRRTIRLRQEFLDIYGRQCACCGESHEEFLTIEHTPDKWGRKLKAMHPKHRRTGVMAISLFKKLGWPKRGIQVLCINCNFSKGIRGYCPHEKEAPKQQKQRNTQKSKHN